MNPTHLKSHGLWSIALVGSFIIGTQWSSQSSDDSMEAAASGRQNSFSSRSGQGAYSGDSGSPGSRNHRSGHSKPGNESSLLSQIFGGSTITKGGIEFLASEAFSDPNPVKRRLAFSKLLEGMTAENASAIRDQLVGLKAGGQEWRDFNYAWGAIAGREAFTDAMTKDRKDLESLITGWAANDPNGAIAMLTELPENLLKQKARLENGIVSGLADRDRDEAVNYVTSLSLEGRKDADRLMSIVAGEALRKDGPEGASLWTESLPEGPLKGAAMNSVASRYVRSDPEAAAGWIEKFADQKYADRAVREVGGEWAEKDPKAAVTWLDKLPDGEGQKSGLNSAFDDWEDRDPVAAGTYLLSMSDSPKRDSAIKGFVSGYASQDPETALAWADDISDPAIRQQSQTKAGQYYFRKDPEAARNWLAGSGLPEKVQQEILNPKRRRR